jgi:hypothetical protein
MILSLSYQARTGGYAMPMYEIYKTENVKSVPTRSDMLDQSFQDIRRELPQDVADHHERIVRMEIARLMQALKNIERGYPCVTKEDMQRVARETIPAKYR